MNTVLPTTLPLDSRSEHAVRKYAEVHQDLARVVRNYDKLIPTEHHAPKDDPCLTGHLIGQWPYPWSERERTCSRALAEPGSGDGAILARSQEAMKRFAVKEVRRALEAQDLADAEAAALAYRASPGADSEILAGWSKDFWQAVHGQKRPAEREQQVASVIAQLANEYPQAKTMSEPDFTHWVIADTVVSDRSMVSSIRIREDTLDLLVSQDDLPIVAANLYKFVGINDAFAARCGCDARTNVGAGEVGFPAYLFRLDPEERTSKILIAIGGPATGFPLEHPLLDNRHRGEPKPEPRRRDARDGSGSDHSDSHGWSTSPGARWRRPPSMSRASVPRTSPAMMRFGRSRRLSRT